MVFQWRNVKTFSNLLRILSSSRHSQTAINHSPYTFLQNGFFLTQHPYRKTRWFPISYFVGYPPFKQLSSKNCGFCTSSPKHENQEKENGTSESQRGFDKVVRVATTLKNSPSVVHSLSQLNALRGVPPTGEVLKIMCIVEDDWKACLSLFHWAEPHAREKSEKVDLYHTLITILARHRRFSLAWSMADKMKQQSMLSSQTMRIIIEGYIVAGDVSRAVRTFSNMEYFGPSPNYDDLLSVLKMLCKHMYVADAEILIDKNKKHFPLDIKSFNVVLDAWCNIMDDKHAVKRVWEKLADHCIRPDALSYMTVIPYYMKAEKFSDVVRLYGEMRKQRLSPTFDIANSVISVLAKQKCVKEAMNLFNNFKELGLTPDAVTYTCIIKLLCRTWKKKESWDMLEKMIEAGFSPPLEIHHCFFRFIADGDIILKHLVRMIKTGSSPTAETMLLSIRKCCMRHDYKTYFLLMKNMESFDFYTNMNTFHLILNSVFILGKPEDACAYYSEMKAKGFSLEPELSKYFESELVEKEVRSAKGSLLDSELLFDAQSSGF